MFSPVYFGIKFSEFKNNLCNMLRSKEGLVSKLGQFIEYFVGEIFIEKYAQNVHQKLVSGYYLIFLNS